MYIERISHFLLGKLKNQRPSVLHIITTAVSWVDLHSKGSGNVHLKNKIKSIIIYIHTLFNITDDQSIFLSSYIQIYVYIHCVFFSIHWIVSARNASSRAFDKRPIVSFIFSFTASIKTAHCHLSPFIPIHLYSIPSIYSNLAWSRQYYVEPTTCMSDKRSSLPFMNSTTYTFFQW